MGVAPDELLAMREPFRRWLKPRLEDGSYFGFVITDEGPAVAGVGLQLIDWPPHPRHPTEDRRGYVLNMWVDPAYRRRGLARRLMGLSEAEFARRGVGFAVLHASDFGRPLYERLGWEVTPEMGKAVSRTPSVTRSPPG